MVDAMCSAISKNRTKGPNWSLEETRTFLELCTDKKVIKLMDSKKFKHMDIFKLLVSEMQEKGYDKTAEQMKLKFKKLKQDYLKCKDNNNKSGAAPLKCPLFDELDLLFSLRPALNIDNNSQGFDTAAVDADIESELDNPIEVNEDSTTTCDEFYDPGEGTSATPQRSCKRRCLNTPGRKSYKMAFNDYSEKLLENQSTLLNETMTQLIQQQKEMIEKVQEDQRQWETEMLEKEQEFQKQQTETLMNTFAECIRSLKQPSIPIVRSQAPLRVINLTSPPSPQIQHEKKDK